MRKAIFLWAQFIGLIEQCLRRRHIRRAKEAFDAHNLHPVPVYISLTGSSYREVWTDYKKNQLQNVVFNWILGGLSKSIEFNAL